MAKKLTYTFIKQQIEEEGYTLLSSEYINSKTKLDYICPKGHFHSAPWNKWINGHRCASCGGTKRHSYSYIKQLLNDNGITLLSNEYVNQNTKLEVICKNGHKHKTTWGSLKTNFGCPYCSKNAKPTFEEVKSIFKDADYNLLSEEYKNNHIKLDYICPNGHAHSITLNDFKTGYRCPTCAYASVRGSGSARWKGGVSKNNLPLYETYAVSLEKYHQVYKINQADLELLGIECAYCGKVFVPRSSEVETRVKVIKGKAAGEANFYCSENCKTACPTYRQRSYPKGFKPASSREVQPELRKLVLKRDNFACKICGNSLEYIELHCHHITGVEQNPIESADVDNCITLCKECHKKVHKLPGCGYNDLSCKSKN